ncbi:ABC transporter permease [Spongiactinospora sp. 9N601]|uniref:ABC transporter permease n=1 Tax=Spongiactinospora sp. 9N601 TaxID=3375149 RepID=UPI0037B04D00
MTAIGVFASEVTKARSVRSTYWTLIVGVVGAVGLGVLVSAAMVAAWDQLPRMQRALIDPVTLSLGGLDIAIVALVVFGALVITSEYGSRQIAGTLTAVPRRGLLLGGKAMVVGLFGLVAGVVAAFASFFAGQALLATADLQASLGDPGVFWSVARGALLLPLVALVALAVGTLVRSSAGTIAIMIGGIYLPGFVAMLLPKWPRENIYPFFPGAAVTNMIHPGAESWARSAAGASVILAGWTVVLLAAAVVALRRRDA